MTDTSTVELSERELEILKLIATGASNKDIATRLFISPNTVKVHLRNIFSKISVSSRTEAAMYALREGLVLHPAAPDSAGAAIQEGLPAWLITARAVWDRLGRYRWPAAVALVVVFLAVLSGLVLAANRLLAAPSGAVQNNQTGVTFPTRWQALSSLPQAHTGLGVVAYENDIYAIAGETAAGVSGSVTRYTPATDAWQSMAPKPHPVADVQAALLGEKIYVPGGRQADGQPTNILEVYDPRKDAWEQLASLPAPRSAYALAAFEGRLYLFGGWDGQKPVATVYEYDPEKDAWQARTPMNSPRDFAGAAVVSSKIFIIGGFDGAKASALNMAYYPQRDQDGEYPWETRAPLPKPRYGMGVASLADTIYVIGGDKEANAQNEEYSPETDRWVPFENPPVQVGSGAGLVVYDNGLYTLGGAESGKLMADNQIYQAIYTVVIPLIQK